MKISFIIPAYNEEKYIGKCLESIIKEVTNSSIEGEIIVVNNASIDCTKEVASSFANVKIVDEPQKGVCFARQAGFVASTGELIVYIDADSQLTPGWIKTATEKINSAKTVAISGPAIFSDMPVLTNLVVWCFYYVGFLSYLLNRFILRSGSWALGSNIIIKRSALTKIGGINTNFQFYGDDTDLAKRLSNVGRVIFTFSLPVYTSGRRLKKEGIITMGLKYQINYYWTLMFKKPFTKNYIDVRPTEIAQKPERTNVKKLNNFLFGAKAFIAMFLLAFLFHSPTGSVMTAKADDKIDHAFSYTKSTIKKIHFHRHTKPLPYG